MVSEIVKFLDDSVLEDYNRSIKNFNKKARENLNKYGSNNGELTGSSTLMNIQLAEVLPEGIRLATREDLEKAIAEDNSFLADYYADFGVALRSANDSYKPNDLLAKRLTKQLKERDIELGNGKLIYLNALSLAENKKSAYGLVINLKENAKSNSIKNLEDFKWDYERSDGLAGAYLDWYRGWASSYVHLELSADGGRVVVVSGEATAKNSDELKKVRSALNAGKAFEYEGTIYVPVKDKTIKIK